MSVYWNKYPRKEHKSRLLLSQSGLWLRIACVLSFFMACSPLSLETSFRDLANYDEDSEGVSTDFSDFHRILQRTGCQDFSSYVWNYIYKVASFEQGTPPPYHTVKEQIVRRIQNLMRDHPASKKDINSFAMRFVEIYALITEFMDQYGAEELTDMLVQFEYGIANESHSAWTNRLKGVFAELESNAKVLNSDCQDEEDSFYAGKEGHSGWGQSNQHPLVAGARKVMATAYQSCSVLDMPVLPLHHNVRGIRASSRHPSGQGWRRVITNLQALNSSHYYLQNGAVGRGPQCLNVRQSPLIYDFGGKPSTIKNSINLFRNAGSGSKALGVDCSGFVASAMASAGLRLKPRVFIRSVHVKAVSSWMFKTARRNRLSCLKEQDISAENPLQVGDIIASNSHTVIVDSTGADPFQLSGVRQASQCHSKKMSATRFNFVVIQSSAHNNGTGINRMRIGDSAEGGIKRGLERVASRACYKMFGENRHIDLDEISILRHSSNDPRCRDKEVYMEHQECVRDCTSL